MINNYLPQSTIDQMVKDRKVRTAITRQSHFLFFHFYFAHYVKYETAPFQREIFQLTERPDIKNLFMVAFRGSAKSTIMTMSYPIWAILGIPQKKFVLLLCQTRIQAKQHMMNLKRELENNQLLKNDLGPFQEETDEWGSFSLVFSRLNARITAASTEQSIRGLRHNQYRPDLIVGDDVEDISSTKSREGREKTYQWLVGEVIPSGDRNTQLVIIGNLLHEDSLLMHLKGDLENGSLEGQFRSYPLVNSDEKIAWPGKYPTLADIEQEKKKVGSDIAWQREYMLRIIPEDNQVVFPEYIKYYDELPSIEKEEYRFTWFGVDPAISQKSTADFTAIVGAQVHGYGENMKIYILPNPTNKRLNFPDLVEHIKLLLNMNKGKNAKVLVENVAYQASVFQQLQREGYLVEGVKILGDKRERVASITHLMSSGKILFPRHGAELIIQQLLGFGAEKFDDLVDGFTLLIHKVIENNQGRPDITWIRINPNPGGWRSVSSFEDLFQR